MGFAEDFDNWRKELELALMIHTAVAVDKVDRKYVLRM